MKLAISNRLRVVAGGVDIGHDRLGPPIDGLAAAQRIAAIEQQSRPALAQRTQSRRDSSAIVQIRRMIDSNHRNARSASTGLRASATANSRAARERVGRTERRAQFGELPILPRGIEQDCFHFVGEPLRGRFFLEQLRNHAPF